MTTINVLSVNISGEKGIIKKAVSGIVLTENGITGDAHAGHGPRQVSLLGMESMKKMESVLGRMPTYGEFAENITTQDLPLTGLKRLDRFTCGELILEVTQIGKKCHGENCSVFRETGECIMPTEGVFARVIKPGTLKAGDSLEYHPKVLHAAIITVSDRASRGEYEDKSGPQLAGLLTEHFAATGRPLQIKSAIVPDDIVMLREMVGKMISEGMDVVFTTGGTGIGPRDNTPEAIRPLIDKEIPGIMEMIRVKYGMQFSNALLSRGIAGLAGNTLIYTLPGSPGAIRDYCMEILGTIEHSLAMIYVLDH
jgi:molybdenum cofactor synthesis domain-containing protein